MDRPEPGLIKWSPSGARDSFLHINFQHRIVQLYEPTGHARRGNFDFKKLAKHDDLPPLTTYDWSPSIPGLVAVGTSTGVVNLLRIDDNSNAYLELGLKMSRTCQAVAFNTNGKLAVALDRVRSDNCLYIWDVNRLSTMDASVKGFPRDVEPFTDPVDRLEPSVSVSSVKFFEDNPNVLVAGIKGQGLRIHDLREQSNGSVVHFPTKCCNNLAIDYADQNYFASSALDQPGIMVWDRRATHRHDATPTYLDAVDRDGLPWGGALRLDKAVQMEADPALMDSKNSFIRSLRFCRDRAGMLAVLSRTGQLKILSTKQEYVEPGIQFDGSPELLEVRKSFEMDPLYAESSRKNDKIVSFDWVTLSSPVLQPRLLVLRASGAFEVLEKPSFTSEYPFKLIPWQPPHRGLEEGGPYHEPMKFELSQAQEMLAPLLTEQALASIPVFGPDKPNVAQLTKLVEKAILSNTPIITLNAGQETGIPDVYQQASSVAEKLAALRLTLDESSNPQNGRRRADSELPSQLERHEELLSKIRNASCFPNEAQAVLDHSMLIRAKEGYLFNYAKNQQVVADDPWLQDVWAWVAGAEEIAQEMVSHPLDMSYMGVYTIWMNDLGSKPLARLTDSVPEPDRSQWERCLNSVNKTLGIPRFDGVETRRPHHREMCLEICNLGRFYGPGYDNVTRSSLKQDSKKDSTVHTMAAAQALFRGDTKEAVQILKRASTEHPELLFVSLALQLTSKSDDGTAKEALDFDERVASKTDPYLRAISSIIATGDWAAIANQRSLPLRDRVYVAVRNFSDQALTGWLCDEVRAAIEAGDIEGIVLTGITDPLVDILAKYVERFNDYQTATLLLSTCAPRYIDDVRAGSFRAAYRAYLQRHHAFFLRAKFDMESTKRSKHQGRPTLRTPGRQIALRCVYCDAQASLNAHNHQHGGAGGGASGHLPGTASPVPSSFGGGGGGGSVILSGGGGSGGGGGAGRAGGGSESGGGGLGGGGGANPFTEKMVAAGISCPTCKRHLPRCVVCLEVVGMPRSDLRSEISGAGFGSSSVSSRGGGGMGSSGMIGGGGIGGDLAAEVRMAARFPTFCLRCEHVLHLDHARQWFARHQECPVPECRCKCNFRANPELNYR